MTVETFLKSVLRVINVLSGGADETPTTEELADALEGFNALINEWQIVRPAIFAVKEFTNPLTASQQTYTMGAGGDFDTAWPVKIANASILHANGIKTPLNVISKDQWNAIISPNNTDTVPLSLFCDYAFPLANVRLHPKPSGTPTLYLYLWQELTEPLALIDEFAFPPGYANAFKFSLALDLALEWGKPISDDIRKRATETKAQLGLLNETNKEAVEAAPPAQ